MKLDICADHADLILAKNRKDSVIVFESEHSIVILDKKMPSLFISCTDFSEIKALIRAVEPYYGLTMAVHQRIFLDCFSDYDGTLECVNLLYEKDILDQMNSLYPIVMLDHRHVKQASQLYRKTDFNAYVEHCILKDVCYGMFDQDRLIAMVGEHDEETIGLLEVHPDYRRRHLGLILLNYMMHVQKGKGKLIASQVQVDNAASLNLHEKLGFTKGNDTIVWMRHRKRKL